MKRSTFILILLLFSSYLELFSQESITGKEFFTGGNCNYSDSLFIKNVLNVYTNLPPLPSPLTKDQFETTEDFNKRMLKFQTDIKNFNNQSLKPIVVQNVTIYNKVIGRDFLGNGFSYNADTKILTLACAAKWCIPCTNNNMWDITSNTIGYTSSSKKFVDFFERNGVNSSHIKEYWYWINLEVEPSVAKELYDYTKNGGETSYSISLSVKPKLVYNTYFGLVPIVLIDSYSLIKGGQVITKYNPKNLPLTTQSDEEILIKLKKRVINMSSGSLYDY